MNSHLSGTIIFKEEQRFSHPCLVIPLLILTIFLTFIIAYGMYRQLIQGIPFGNRPMSNESLKIVGPLIIGLIWGIFYLFIYMRLRVLLFENSLVIHFRPLSKKVIDYQQIKSCAVTQYRPIKDFGGWGIRFRSGETAYTISGNKAVRLSLKDGKNILIGSNQPEELAAIITNKIKNLS
ncbi:MAG TPA: hypothetical protein PLW02_12330 [Verrucomicrobiota bacterium]|nr:hypothetical protein [Verrucomicrobiota bacterium]